MVAVALDQILLNIQNWFNLNAYSWNIQIAFQAFNSDQGIRMNMKRLPTIEQFTGNFI